MAKFKVTYPKGPQGDASKLPQRLAQIGVVYSATDDEYSFDHSIATAPKADYLASIANEYGGVIEIRGDKPSEPETESK